MADKVPVRASYSGANALTGLATFASSETIATTHGGTGASSASGALINLGSTSAGTQTVIQNAANASLASQNASKIILVDLIDPGIIWDYEKFITTARYTSWFQELGVPPVHGAMWINDATTELKWWNLDTDTEYAKFESESNDMFIDAVDLFFLDGVLYIAVPGAGVGFIDFLRDSATLVDATNWNRYLGDIEDRNGAKSYVSFRSYSSTNLSSTVVRSVVAHRDGFFVDEFDRPKHWWMAGTNIGPNAYNPVDDTIYTSDDGQICYAAAITTGGKMFITQDFGGVTDADQVVYYQMEKFWVNATAQSNMFGQYLTAAAAGFRSLSFFGSSYVPDTLAAYEIGVAGGALGLFGCNEGLVFAHMLPDERANPNEPNGGLILVTSSYQTPYMKGFRAAAYPLESLNDRTGNGYTLSEETGTITYSTGLFSGLNGAVFDGSTTLLTTAVSGFDPGSDGDFTCSLWMKTSSATQSADTTPIYIGDSGQSAYITGYWGNANSYWTWRLNTGAGNRDLTGPSDLYDANWHLYTFLRRGSVLYAYVDGVQYSSSANTDNWTGIAYIRLGGWSTSTNLFAGTMAMFSFQKSAFSDEEVKFEYQRGLRGLGGATATLANTNVTSVKVDQNTGLAAITTTANQTEIWDATMGLRESIDSTTTATIADADVSLKTGAENPEYITGRSGAIEYDGKVRRVLG